MNPTYELARYCAELTYDQLPEEVVAKAKRCILDYCGIVVGARKIETSERVAEFVRQYGPDGQSSVIGYECKTSAPMAALANGTFAETLEYQDGVRVGGNHPQSAVLPAAVAVAEAQGSSGKDFITAVVAGYEAENRIAAAVYPSHFRRGHLPTATIGSIGAAVASSRLLGFDPQETTNAMGIAGFLTPFSISENLWGAYTIKVVHGGYGARMGVEAAAWVRLDFTGCPLEGSPLRPRGFCAVASDNPNYEEFTEGLGERFNILDVYFKPYACCRVTHSAVEATLGLAEENDLRPENIESVQVTTYDYAAETVGANYPDASANFLKCQFSMPYVVAVSIADREVSLPQFTSERIVDPKLLDLSRRVRVVGDEEMTKVWPDTRPSQVEIRTVDGRKFVRRVDYPLGDKRNPLPDDQFLAKFDLLISFGLGANRSQEIRAQVDKLDTASNISGLIESLA